MKKAETATPHFRMLLQNALESRSAKNPRYSLRSFARDLGISPQRLSDIIRGRYGLSAIQAQVLATRLGLSENDRRRFVCSAEMLHARSPMRRKRAQEEFALADAPISTLTLDAFQVISDWYHYAILELTYLPSFRSDVSWIAKQLDLSPFVVEQAIARLMRLELLEKQADGCLKCTQTHLATPSGVPSEALRKFHRQLLEKAILALETQSVDERDFASVVMTVDRGRLEEAKQDLKLYRREFGQKYGSDPNQNEVYCLGVQFFRLQIKNQENRK